MKFRDGYWGVRNDVKLLNRIEMRDVTVHDDSLTIYSSSKKTIHRGDTLNAPIMTTELSSPLDDVIRVRVYRFKGGIDRGPWFPLNGDPSVRVNVCEGEHDLWLTSGDTKVSVSRQRPWDIVFTYENRLLTKISQNLSGHVTMRDGSVFICEHLTLSVAETIYGLGERFAAFVKNGQAVDIWNEDGGTSSEQAYKNIPFYISSRGYGVLVSDPGKVSFEVASEVVTTVQFSVPGEILEYYIIGGRTLKDVLRTYTRLVGRPALPPPWSFGLWLTTSFTTEYDEKTVTSFIEGMERRNIPLHVFHFDCFWMREYQWVDFTWDKQKFPDPEGMLKRLKKRGLHICVWINPYIAQKSRLFDEGMARNYLVRKPDGGVWQWDRWQAGMALVDFTNPEAVAWYRGKLKNLLEMGVDAFKTDFGERIPTDVVYHDGSDPLKMHNYYTYLYNKTVFDLLEETKGKHEAMVFARSATVGSQRFPVHWGGDCSATYESMAESLRGGLSLSCSGFGFWSHDIGGFESTATPDLFKRWVAFGLLSSHSRLHGNESYRVPWYFDDESSDVLRFFVRLKCSLMPYLYGEACKTHAEGIPLMRAMVLDFPEDPACAYLDRQYMLGDVLLIAPIFSEDGLVSYYLPSGVWTNFISGESIEGGRWRTEKHGYMSLPVMVRPNSIVAVGADHTRTDYDFADNVCFHVFALNMSAQTKICNAAGEIVGVCTVTEHSSGYSASFVGTGKPWSLLFHGLYRMPDTDGGRVSIVPQGVLVTVGAGIEQVEITVEK